MDRVQGALASGFTDTTQELLQGTACLLLIKRPSGSLHQDESGMFHMPSHVNPQPPGGMPPTSPRRKLRLREVEELAQAPQWEGGRAAIGTSSA